MGVVRGRGLATTPITEVVAFYGVRVHKCNGVRTQGSRSALERSGYRCAVHKLQVNILRRPCRGESRVPVCFFSSSFNPLFPRGRSHAFSACLRRYYGPRGRRRGYLAYRETSTARALFFSLDNLCFPPSGLGESAGERDYRLLSIFKRCSRALDRAL